MWWNGMWCDGMWCDGMWWNGMRYCGMWCDGIGDAMGLRGAVFAVQGFRVPMYEPHMGSEQVQVRATHLEEIIGVPRDLRARAEQRLAACV